MGGRGRRAPRGSSPCRSASTWAYLFNGVSALPFEELGLGQVPDALTALAAERAVARFCLDLVEATTPRS